MIVQPVQFTTTTKTTTTTTITTTTTTNGRAYLDLRANLLDVCRNSCYEPSSPAAAENDVQGLAVALLENLHADRALPRDNLVYGG